jgi:hypothetical protein
VARGLLRSAAMLRHIPLLAALAIALSSAGCENSIDGSGDEPPAFTVPRDRVVLLPFRVRLARVAQVLGAGTDAPELELMRASATALGDHDYAAGIKPNLQWSASRMASWVRALEPVCASDAFRARYPALPAGADDLIAAAWGRAATADDLAAIEDGLTGLPIDDAERYTATCLAVLSALEMVAQ